MRSRNGSYLPTLDGWRAIAILGVLAYHDRIVTFGHFSDAALHRFGFLGVDLFFAISGLLICSRLLEEECSTGRIDVRTFYVRRAFRILPPAFLYLATIAFLTGLGVLTASWREWFAALFFYRNYYLASVQTVTPYTMHYWSLSIEEHFYLFLPLFLVLAKDFRTRALAAAVILELALRTTVHAVPALLTSLGGESAYRRTELNCLGLLTGAWLAVLLTQERPSQWIVRWLTPLNAVLLIVLMACLLRGIAPGLGALLVAPLGFPIIVVSTVKHPNATLSRFLECPPLRSIGHISYSLYLWQQLFLAGEVAPTQGLLHTLQQRPYNLIATVLCALTSYFFVEKPFIRAAHALTYRLAARTV